MEQKDLEIKDVVIMRMDDGNHRLLFITDEMFRSDLLNDLGWHISVDYIEETSGNILLKITFSNNTKFTFYNTQRTLSDYPKLELLQKHEVGFWSVGNRTTDNSISWHVDPFGSRQKIV